MAKNDPRPELTHRQKAIEWWNEISSAGRTRMCDIYTELVGSIRRWETLTGREIELIYNEEQKAKS